MKRSNLLYLITILIGCVFLSGCIVNTDYVLQDQYQLYGYDDIDIAVNFDTVKEKGVLFMLMNDARGNNVTLLFDYTQVEKNKITGFPYAVYLDGVEYHTSYVKDVYFILVDNT